MSANRCFITALSNHKYMRSQLIADFGIFGKEQWTLKSG